MSRDAVAARLTQHAATAASSCPSLASKHVTPHVLRHTAARNRHHRHRALARPRKHRNHTGLPARRHDHERKRRGPNHTGTRPGRSKPPDDDLMTFLQNL